MRIEFIYFWVFILSSSVGIYLIYHGLLKRSNPSDRRKISSKKVDFFAKFEKYFRSVTELVGISPLHIAAEFVSKLIILFVVAVIASKVLSLSMQQMVLLALAAASWLTFWIQRYRSRVITKYRERFELQFTDFVDSLALTINSGLPLIAGLYRVIAEHLHSKDSLTVKRGKIAPRIATAIRLIIRKRENESPLNRELSLLQKLLDEGSSVATSFDFLSVRLNSLLLSNFTDAVVLSMSRGTPLASLLNSHAQTMRDSQRRKLLERAGRAEVKMMMPVIFLLLPISVLFALWPSFQQLQQMVVSP